MSLDRLLSSSLTIRTNVPGISQLRSASIAKTNNSCYISLVQYKCSQFGSAPIALETDTHVPILDVQLGSQECLVE